MTEAVKPGQNKPTTNKTSQTPVKTSEPKQNKDGSLRKPPVRKQRAALDFSQIKVTKATEETLRQHRRTRGERDTEQKAVDTLVRQVHEAWVSAGRPEEWREQAGVAVHLRIPSGQYETLEWRLRKAGEYFDVAIRLSDRTDVDGYVEFVFLAKDRPVKAEKETETDASGGDSATG